MAGRVQGKVAKVAAKALPKAKAAKNKIPDIPKRRPPTKPKVSNRKLQNIINDIWKHAGKKGTAGDGTTIDAIRNELLTGRSSNGIWHLKKGQQLMNGLKGLLAKKWGRDILSPEERRIAQQLYNELRDAYRQGGGHPPNV
ncbi:hypothetical protein [Tenggerimyces flavus]|uniref:Uncharacterized protein n=1 Tax=Tenggerimyces flavus TaxID=1708749 RepID=A0ABV7Y8J7_9ACTN|nr:hypothetical protein [Tenggerimyces flavus]MBM7783622.1 hypothetical protein [Tenggerimyces flavus]